jgi:xylose dehydrogenase (NAD/NADP)
VKWGVLGATSRIHRQRLRPAIGLAGQRIVAEASRTGDDTAPYAEVLADPAVDAVYVPLPNSLHMEWSIRALQAGKHVLCEKPLTRHPEQAKAAFDAAERAGRVLAEGFMWRHHPQARRLRSLLAEGAVGELRLVRAAFSFDIFGMDRPHDVRLQAGLDGGGLMDVGCYCVSAMRLLAGEPERVGGRRVDGGDGVDVRFTGTMAFAGGVLGSFDCGLDMVARSELEVVGDAGSLFLPDPWHSRAPRIELRRSGGSETIEIPGVDPYACELEDFAAAVRGERPHPFGRADAVAQARVIAALYRAAESGADEAP